MNKFDFTNRRIFRSMTEWFSPSVLLKAANQAVTTTMFSNYADRRLTQALSDIVSDDRLSERVDVTHKIQLDSDGSFWLDYVADIGDGFNPTYSIAYLLGKKTLKVNDNILPRGQLLIMGGDQVYPAASYEDYRYRFEDLYKYALPKASYSINSPSIYMIPGNHDWYDGLSLFLGKFCKGKGRSFGGWTIGEQHRSYWALRLPHDWWIWAFDSQVDDANIDTPQDEYFERVAKLLPENAKVIVCAPVPVWIKLNDNPDERKGIEEFQRCLDHISQKVTNLKNGSRIYAVLSGDTHHYHRYSDAEHKAHFITSGGGGAFLHPTHHLPENIKLPWLREKCLVSLCTDPVTQQKTSKEACYPSKKISKNLANGNKGFLGKNWKFCSLLGIAYLVLCSMLGKDSTIWEVISNPLYLVLWIGLGAVLWKYADSKNALQKLKMGVFHSLMHILGIGAIKVLVETFMHWIKFPAYPEFWISALLTFSLGYVVGGFIWGKYLQYSSLLWGLHKNDAFSAMAIEGYKNFLRLKVSKDQLHIYPIGLDKVPNRNGWKENLSPTPEEHSEILPKEALAPHLIEGPIIIK